MKLLKILGVGNSGFLLRAFELFALEKRALTAFIILSILAAVTEGASMSLIIPILQSQAENSNFSQIPVLGRFLEPLDAMSQMDALMVLSLILAGVIIIRGIVQFGAQSLGAIIPLRLNRSLAQQVYNALSHSTIGFVESKDHGELYTTIRDHTQRVSSALNAMISTFYGFALIGAYFVLMMVLSVKMTLLSLAFIAILGIAVKKLLITPLKGIGRDMSTAQVGLHGQFLDTLNGMRLIHLRAAEQLMRNKYTNNLTEYYHADRKRLLIAVGQSPLVMTAAGLFICALIFGGATLADQNDASWLGLLLVFVLCLYRMLTPAVMIANARATIAGNSHSIEALDEFLNEAAAAIQPSGDIPFEAVGTGVRIEGVHFSYNETQPAVLNGIDIEIEHGSLVALVGASGAGKSSIAGLLTRFYDPQKGRILINGVDLNDLDLKSWRQKISVVTQNTILFNDTIRNNLSFGLGEVSHDEILAAAKRASADEFIDALPDGYDTKVGERGARLSGGQQQRLALARAFVSNPEFLILDEATNQLDSVTENAIQMAIESFREKTTILVIAHRLATIKKADMIYVMDHGEVIECGNHEALFRKKGIYKKMIEQQGFDLVDDKEPFLDIQN